MFIQYLEANLKKIKISDQFFGSGEHWFLHLSKAENLTIQNINCPPVADGFTDKPQRGGLWLAPNTQWANFVSKNRDIETNKFLYKVKINLDKILIPKQTPLKDVVKDISFKKPQDDLIYYRWKDILDKKIPMDGIWFNLPVPYSWSIVNESVCLFNKSPIKEIKFIGDVSKALKIKRQKDN